MADSDILQETRKWRRFVEASLAAATSAGASGLGVWRYRTETVPPPASGQIRFDNATIALATEFYLHETNDGGTDVSVFLDTIAVGSLMYIQQKSDADNFIIIEVGSIVDSGTYRTIGIANGTGQGAGISQNTEVTIFISGGGSGGGSGNPFATPLQVLADINTATPPTNEAVNNFVEWLDLAGDDLLARLGFLNSNTMTLRNFMHGGQIRIEGENAAGTNRGCLIFRPDSSTSLNAVSNLLLTAGNNQNALLATANAQVALYYDDTLAAQTRLPADGGLGAYNTYSGGGSHQRVLTDSDQSYTDIRMEFSTNTSAADPGNRHMRWNNASIVAATEMYINDLDTQSDNNEWWMRALLKGDTFVITDETDKTALHVIELTGDPVNNTGWWTIPINRIAGQASNIINNAQVRLHASFGLTAAGDPSKSGINTQDGNYTLVLSDAGETIYKAAGGAGETYTIPANASVAYPIGTWVAFDNDGGGDLSIAITTDVLEGTDGATGTRTLGDNQRALAHKLTATKWRYSASDL